VIEAATLFSAEVSPMLVARRDPPFHSGAHEASPPFGTHAAPHQPRFMTALQVVGSLLAIPVGLASGYSIYHANFSDEARCQGLRANIVSMLDKSADASTLRMLVRRDVMAFETSCGKVDPDAVAAFKTLLAAPTQRVAHAPQPSPKTAEAKPAPVAPVKEASAPTAAHSSISDTKWLAAVRQALVHKPATQSQTASSSAPRQLGTPPHPLGQLIVPAVAPGAAAAPALPPPAAVAKLPQPANSDNHPLPPASIPEPAPQPAMAFAAPAESNSGSGIYRLMAKIPLLNRVVGH
jgi:hypothetical protein